MLTNTLEDINQIRIGVDSMQAALRPSRRWAPSHRAIGL